MKQRKRSGGVEFLFQLWYHEKKREGISVKRVITRLLEACLTMCGDADVTDGAVTLDVAPQLIDGRTMLPVRAVCEY